MRYQFFLNVDTDFMSGFKNGQHLKLVYSGEIHANGPLDGANRLYELFNIEHPADYKDRSMSCGDVVVVDGKAFSCEFLGWRELENFACKAA